MRTLQHIAGFCFFALGLLFVAAYVLLRGELLGVWPAYILQYGDLPLLLSGLLYGALSLYFSLTNPAKPSRTLQIVLSIVTVLLFAGVCAMNFWIA